jgi:hypothetical protein
MKLLTLGIPLLIVGGAAIARPDPDYSPPAGTTALISTPDAAAPGGMLTTTVTTPASGRVIQAGNTKPAHDNLGNRVISADAVVPDGYNGVTHSAAVGGPEEDVADVRTVPITSAGVPACSRTITDNCVETYNQNYAGPYTTH